ncbi:TPR domain-containing protein [Rostrohypoxylon terebratum]|nr:TPR domain-containing protein [Rostrohypoxylon terebratum]
MSASRAVSILSFTPSNNLQHARYAHKRLSRQFALLSRAQIGRTRFHPTTSHVAVIANSRQTRWESSASSPESNKQKPPPPPPPPPPSFRLLLRALRQSLSLRPIIGAFRDQSLRSLFRQSPEELVIAIILLSVISGACVYVAYAYFNYFQSEQFTRFPPEIAKSLRRALYYSNYAPDHKLALKYYRLALEQCTQAGLDPFSDEVMGLRIQFAAWFEKIGSHKNAINALESLLRDNKQWVAVMEKSVRDGLIDNSGKLTNASKQPATGEGADGSETTEVFENMWAKRTRVLGKSVGISVKLGELYSDEHVLQGDSAGEHLEWAVETVLKELQRRQNEGVKEGEGDWMTPEEIGGALEALGNHYESKSQHYLAAPLFLQAIPLSPPNSCHTAVLMNNLASSLAQQPFDTSAESNDVSKAKGSNAGTLPRRSVLLASARSWALQAQKTAEKIEGENRTSECDETCAVALCNLGEIATMTGDIQEAQLKFQEALDLSKRVSFEPGVVQAEEALQRLSVTPPTGPR